MPFELGEEAEAAAALQQLAALTICAVVHSLAINDVIRPMLPVETTTSCERVIHNRHILEVWRSL